MDMELFHRLKYKVTQIAPAIFADNMMWLIIAQHGVPWNPVFTTREYYEEFFHISGVDILQDIKDILEPLYDIHITFYDMWHVNEDALLKHLYILKMKFCSLSKEDAETNFLLQCTFMIYIALDYYKKGVESALSIAFLEVYFLACYYSERMNFKCDLISASTE